MIRNLSLAWMIAAAGLSGCGTSHVVSGDGDAGIDTGTSTCGDRTCGAGESCCLGCTPAEAVCLTGGAVCGAPICDGGVACGASLCAPGQRCCTGCAPARVVCVDPRVSCPDYRCPWPDSGPWDSGRRDSGPRDSGPADSGRACLATCGVGERCCPGCPGWGDLCVPAGAPCPVFRCMPPPDASVPGACGSLGLPPCAPDEFCDFTPDACGAADVPGLCATRPSVCAPVFHRFCGCDGATYINGCDANVAGVDIAHAGPC